MTFGRAAYTWSRNGAIPAGPTSRNMQPEAVLSLQMTLEAKVPLPSDEDMQEMLRLGVTEIDVVDEIDAEEDIWRFMEFVRFLRDSTSYDMRIKWRGRGCTDFPIQQMFHLHPPVEWLEGINQEEIHAWHNSFRYGSFCWRRGPNFVIVKDARKWLNRSIKLTIGDPLLLNLFEEASMPIDIAKYKIDSAATTALNVLIDAGLTIKSENKLLSLPYRVRHWPIPASDI